MKTDIYNTLKSKVEELNNLNDEISLIEWNKDDGPKFESVKEMKDFEKTVLNGGFDYLFDDTDDVEFSTPIINSFDYTIDNFIFCIYTYEKNDKFHTYLSIKNKDLDNAIYDMCGNISSSRETALSHFEELKQGIINNNIDDIFNNLLTGVDKTIEKLKIRYNELTSES